MLSKPVQRAAARALLGRLQDRVNIIFRIHAHRAKQPARQPGDFMYVIRFVTGGCPSTVKVTLTIDGRSTSRYRALMAIMPSVVLNRATESSGSETVYRSA
jgi:hypothetical protein